VTKTPFKSIKHNLLRKSNQSGGGDLNDPTQVEYAGRWAGDQVYLVGDYDESGLYNRAQHEFANISQPLGEEYNAFVEMPEMQLQLKDFEQPF
jgi:hypothetical protein